MTFDVFSGDLEVSRLERDGPLAHLAFAAPPPQAFAPARAGQFALLGSNRAGAPLLPRPLSILGGDALAFAFAVVGEGTRAIAAAGAGEALYVMGPLGNAFDAAREASLIVTDASHVGTLLALAKERRDAGAPADIVMVDTGTGPDTGAGTGPGAGAGHETPGAALDAAVARCLAPVARRLTRVALADLEAALDAWTRPDTVLAAGARDPVMARVQAHAARAAIVAEAAVQAPLACGIGVCKACTRALREGGHHLVCLHCVTPIAAPLFEEEGGDGRP